MEYIFIKVPGLVNFLEKMFNVTMPSTLLQKKKRFFKALSNQEESYFGIFVD